MKRAVIVLSSIDDSCYKFEVAIEYKDYIEFDKGATWIEVDGVKVYLTGRCEYVITEDGIEHFNCGTANDDLDYKFEEIKDYFDNYY